MAYYFRLPLITDLTTVQQSVLEQTEPVAIAGGPGTGKSVVSLWRHIRNHATGTRRSLMLTYTKTLEHYLAASAANENASAGQAVARVYEWMSGYPSRQGEIIVDEAQDVETSRYSMLSGYSDIVSYGADDQQILYPNRATTQAQLRLIYPSNHFYELDENFRNSYEILHFVKSLLPNRMIPHDTLSRLRSSRLTGVLPKCIVTNNDEAKQLQTIVDVISEFRSETHNIGILLPLQKHVDALHTSLIARGIPCSKYFHDGSEIGEIDNVHVTTFKSSKGIEFDTVILPNFQSWRYNIATLDVVNENDYYVALTRAKRNLYLISSRDLSEINTTVCEKIRA